MDTQKSLKSVETLYREKGLSISELTNRVNGHGFDVSESQTFSWVLGDGQPTVPEHVALADALGVTPDEIAFDAANTA